jgi:APA family basic amino acid/polyamine antiporter
VFLLPTTLAPYGVNTLVAWVVTIGGMMCIAYAFSLQAAVDPGGPHSYVKRAFGEQTAFLTSWSYLVSQWSSVAAVAVAVAGALAHVWKPLAAPGLIAPIAVVAIASLLAVNLRGVRSAGVMQIVTVAIKIIPLVLVVGIVAWRYGSKTPVEALAPVQLTISGVATAGALMLFAMTGFEVSTVAAAKSRDPTRTVPFATMVGTGLVGVIYVGSVTAVMLLLPVAIAASSSAPFADAIEPILGNVAGIVVAIIAAISAFGTCNALLLLSAEVGRSIAGARDLPPLFRRTNAAGVPIGSLLVGAAVAALLVLASTAHGFVAIYIFIALVSTVASLVLYVMCAAAALKLKVARGWAVVAALGLVYANARLFGDGLEATLWGLVLAAAGLPVRWLSRRFSTIPPPEPAPTALRE